MRRSPRIVTLVGSSFMMSSIVYSPFGRRISLSGAYRIRGRLLLRGRAPRSGTLGSSSVGKMGAAATTEGRDLERRMGEPAIRAVPVAR